MKILIVRLSALGDVIHGLPVAARLKQAIPGVELTWLVENAAKDVLVNNPAVDRVLVFPKKEWKQKLKTVNGLLGLPSTASKFAKELKSFHFDAVIDLQGLLKSALLAVASGAPRRFGFKTGREGADWFLTDKLDPGDYFAADTHVVDLNLRLADLVIANLKPSDKSIPRSTSSAGPPQSATFFNPVAFKDEGSPEHNQHTSTANGLDPKDSLVTTNGSTTSPDGTIGGLPDSGAGATSIGSPDVQPLETQSPKPPIQQISGDSGSTPAGAQPKSYSYIYDAISFPLPAPSSESIAKAEALVKRSLSDSSRMVALIPGTTWESKVWPIDRWADLAKLLGQARRTQFVLIGGPSEIKTNEELSHMISNGTTGGVVHNLTGNTTILDLVALFAKVHLVIGADTGPLHLAAAVGSAPVLAVHGSTPTTRNGPYGRLCGTAALDLECQPCFKKICPLGTTACLRDLSPAVVAEAAVKLASTQTDCG